MTALVTVDCLGKRFDVHVLANEAEEGKKDNGLAVQDTQEKSLVTDQEPPVASTDNHVTTIEISSEQKPPANDANEQNGTEDAKERILETVGDLRQIIAERMDLEPETAKIIHRGKLIGNNKQERLSTLRFKNKDIIKVMGRPMAKAKADPGFSSLSSYERTHLVKLNETFTQNGQDLDLLEKNFLEGKNREEMIKKTEKLLRGFNISAEKHLEAIDALKIYDDSTAEEQKTRNREKRKQIVDGVLKLLNLNDKYLHRLDDYKFRTEHPDEGR